MKDGWPKQDRMEVGWSKQARKMKDGWPKQDERRIISQNMMMKDNYPKQARMMKDCWPIQASCD